MDIILARQIASFVGALLILVAYAGHQMKWIDPRKTAYNVLNAVGSAILAYIAFHPFQIGFVVLEVAWTLSACTRWCVSANKNEGRVPPSGWTIYDCSLARSRTRKGDLQSSISSVLIRVNPRLRILA